MGFHPAKHMPTRIYPCISATFKDNAGLPMAVQTGFEFAHHPYVSVLEFWEYSIFRIYNQRRACHRVKDLIGASVTPAYLLCRC